MGDKIVETLCYFRLLKTNLTPQLYTILHFPLSFLYNIEKGKGCSFQNKLNLKWNNWNITISTRFSQLSQLLLSPIIGLPKLRLFLNSIRENLGLSPSYLTEIIFGIISEKSCF